MFVSNVELDLLSMCLFCGGTGKLNAIRKAKQFNGPDVIIDTVSVTCMYCNGTGKRGSEPQRHVATTQK